MSGALTAEQAAAQLHPTAFAALTMPSYRPQPFHWTIGDHLADLAAGRCDRLLISIPPRHGKTELVSIRFPAWFLGRNPDARVIGASYGSELAEDFGRKARAVISDPLFGAVWPGVKVARDSSAALRWDIEGRRGGYVGAGVGGPLTGRGANLLLIDDPIKNRQEAESETIRQGVWDWYTSTAYTRLEGRGAVAVIATRWHEDDLIGRLLAAEKDGGDRWRVVNLPALDAQGRALWPEKFSAELLAQIRINVGPRDFEALYQQRPQPLEGGLFKRDWWRTYDAMPPMWRVEHVVDSSFKEGVENDPSVIATWGRAERGYYLLDLRLGRWAFPDLLGHIHAHAARWRPLFPGAPVVIEDKASGQSAIQMLRLPLPQAGGAMLPALPVIAFKIKQSASKVSRAEAVTGLVEAGQVYLPRTAPWLEEFIREHSVFPNGVHDDQVDTTSMGLMRLSQAEHVDRAAHADVTYIGAGTPRSQVERMAAFYGLEAG